MTVDQFRGAAQVVLGIDRIPVFARDKRHIRCAKVELRYRAEGHLDADDTKVPGSGLQEAGQSRLQLIVLGFWACQSDDLSVVQLVHHRPPIEWKLLELLDSH